MTMSGDPGPDQGFLEWTKQIGIFFQLGELLAPPADAIDIATRTVGG